MTGFPKDTQASLGEHSLHPLPPFALYRVLAAATMTFRGGNGRGTETDLGALSDHVLRDIGICRDQIRRLSR